MATNFYYVYSITDPRGSRSRPFYVGKGTGSRLSDHALKPDGTAKGLLIQEIVSAGHRPVVEVIADDLTEHQALRLEAFIIGALGTHTTGGMLTNAVVPGGTIALPKRDIAVPLGALERAQLGLELLESAILSLARMNPKGISNADAASALGLRSDYQGKQKDYLTYSVLGLLMRKGKLVRVEGKRHRATDTA